MGSSSLERKIDPFEIGRVTGSGSRERLVLIATGDAASGSRWDVQGHHLGSMGHRARTNGPFARLLDLRL